MRNAFDFYINGSIHVALAVVAFTLITILNFRIPINFSLLLFIFFSTITGYNFIKYAGIAKFHHSSLSFNLRAIQLFSFLSFLGLIITLFFQNFEVLLITGFLAIITLLYALPVSRYYPNLRGIPGLKIFIIAFVVAGVTVILPLAETKIFPVPDQVIDFFQRCIIALVLILPFEIRDMNYDTAQLGTIPQRIGVFRTRRLGYILTLIFCFMEFLKNEIDVAYLLSLVSLGIMCVLFLNKASTNQGKYYASFWVEAAPVFWLGILYFLQLII